MKKILFLTTFVLASNTFGWEDNEDNRKHYKTIRSVSLAAGALWSPSCNDADFADKAIRGFTTIILNSVEDGQIGKEDAEEMMLTALVESAEVAKRTDVPAEVCQASRDLVSGFVE